MSMKRMTQTERKKRRALRPWKGLTIWCIISALTFNIFTPTFHIPDNDFLLVIPGSLWKMKMRIPPQHIIRLRLTMINDHLYEGRFTPRVNGKRISKNVYAKTREECEEKFAELIKTMKAEIAEMKKAKQA